MVNVLLVGLGGFVGSVLRYLSREFIHKFFATPYIPYGTLSVNFIGCLMVGFLIAMDENKSFLSENVVMFLLIGVLGGYTTFSTFGYETFLFFQEEEYRKAFLNMFLNLTLSIAGVFAGYFVSRGF